MASETTRQRYDRAVAECAAAGRALKAHQQRARILLSSQHGHDSLEFGFEYDAVVERLDAAEAELHVAYELLVSQESVAVMSDHGR